MTNMDPDYCRHGSTRQPIRAHPNIINTDPDGSVPDPSIKSRTDELWKMLQVYYSRGRIIYYIFSRSAIGPKKTTTKKPSGNSVGSCSHYLKEGPPQWSSPLSLLISLGFNLLLTVSYIYFLDSILFIWWTKFKKLHDSWPKCCTGLAQNQIMKR